MASSAANSGDNSSKKGGPGAGAMAATTTGRSYFELQREALLGDIAMSFEHVLANINKLNRSLEAVITVGHEFSSVEALWSQFEGVMAHEPGNGEDEDDRQGHSEGDGSEGRRSRGEGDGDGDGETETESEANTTTEDEDGDDTVVQR